MQDINSAERYSQFTQAVLEAAEREAAALLAGAEQEKAEIIRVAENKAAKGEFQQISAKAEHNRAMLSAGVSQALRRNLLLYREELCVRLMDKIREKCNEFVKSDAYCVYLTALLNAHRQELSENGVCVLAVRPCDTLLTEGLCKPFNGVTVKPDAEIALGGIRICIQNKIYDETLDTRLSDEQERFLSYCGLKVV